MAYTSAKCNGDCSTAHSILSYTVEPPVGPVHVAAAREGGDVQSEVDFWVQGARTHATPRLGAPSPRRTPREAPPPEAPDPGLVDPGGGWFWG